MKSIYLECYEKASKYLYRTASNNPLVHHLYQPNLAFGG